MTKDTTKTIHDICNETGRNILSVQKSWQRLASRGLVSGTFDRHAVPTDEQYVLLFGDRKQRSITHKPAASQSKGEVSEVVPPVNGVVVKMERNEIGIRKEPAQKVANQSGVSISSAKASNTTEKDPWIAVNGPKIITFLSICLTITGLYVFVDWAGIMLGGMFALFLFTAVVIARNRKKGDTSEQALNTVLYLEMGASVLHFFTFWRLLPSFPEGDVYVYARIAACVILASFAAYISYSAVLTVRNYNAETDN